MTEAGTPLIKKLGIQPGYSVHLLNPPPNYLTLLGALPEGVSMDGPGPYDFIHAFTRSQVDLLASLPHLKRQLKPGGMLWLSWPKKSSRLNTNLSRDMVRGAGLDIGLVDTKVAAIDDDWSGLKFVYRLADR